MKTKVFRELSTQLLNELSPKNDQLHAYRSFLRAKGMNFSANQSTAAALPDRILLKWLKVSKYFDIRETSHVCLLEKALNVRIVLYTTFSKDTIVILHDKRGLDLINALYGGNTTKLLAHFFKLSHTVSKKKKKIKKWCLQSTEAVFSDQTYFKQEETLAAVGTHCIMNRLTHLLAVPNSGSPDCCSRGECKTLIQLLADPDSCVDALGEFILVSHISTGIKRGWKNLTKPKNSKFSLIGEFIRDATRLKRVPETTPIVHITMHGQLRLLTPQFASSVISGLYAPTANTRSELTDLLRQEAEEEARSSTQSSTQSSTADDELVLSDNACRCAGCVESAKFKNTMNSSGPQKKFSQDLPMMDLLRLFGLFSPENEALLNTVSDWCLSAYDIESLSLRCDSRAGNENLLFSSEPVTECHVGREVFVRQVPALIGFSDLLSLSQGKEVEIFQVINDDVTGMIVQFVDAVVAAARRAEVEKERLLAPFFDFVLAYKEKHFAFFAERNYVENKARNELAAELQPGGKRRNRPGDPDNYDELYEKRVSELQKQITSAWTHSIFGKFETRLEKLVSQFWCLGFNRCDCVTVPSPFSA